MILKTWIDSIRNPELPLQDRMFRLLTGIALFTLFLMIIINIIIMEHLIDTLALAIGFVFFSSVYVLSIAKNRVDIGGIIIALVITFVLIPIIFLTGGGVYGGAPIWLVFCSLYVCLVVVGKARFVFVGISVAVATICYAISYFHPALLPQHTLDVAYVDSLTGVIAVTLLLSLMVIFQATIYEGENKRSRAQAKEIEELNHAQNRFFSSMSHEIRTPINTIIGLDEMILREVISDEVAEDARQIQGASKMLLSLINDILDLSKIESGKMTIIPASYETGAMLSEIVNMIWVRAHEKDLAFHIDVDPSLPSMLFGDEVRIKQVLLNVLNNAVKYTAQGSVTLSLHSRQIAANRVKVTYQIEDTGIGIKKESLPYLFDAFKRVDEERIRTVEGTGLGLAIVKQLVELMGGTISVSSIYTKGSVFTIEIDQDIVDSHEVGDLNLESRHQINEREHYKQSFEAPSARILIVDDSESNLLVATKLLRDTKVQMETATSGEEALKKTVTERFDVILMDHLMPGMDGIACLHAIRSQVGGLCTETPVVALTANAGRDSQALYAKEGFNAYLVKPVNGALLEACVLKLLPRELVTFTSAPADETVVSRLEQRRKERVGVLVTTDSICDLPQELVEQNRISVMPYQIVTDRGVFLDGVESDSDGVLAYVADGTHTARSEAPDVASYEAFFADMLTRAQNIIHITMTSKASRGYSHALQASRSFHNVTVIDSGQLSSATGLLVLHTCRRLASHDTTVASLANELEAYKRLISTSFILDNTEYLSRSGRISARVNNLCHTMLLHPVIVLKKGIMGIGGIKIGRQDAVWSSYIRSALKKAGTIDPEMLFITYAGLSPADLEVIKAQVLKIVPFKHVYFQKAAPAISINCGPGTFGLLFSYKGGLKSEETFV